MDRPAHTAPEGPASDEEIEVTPAMIDAGTEFLIESGFLVYEEPEAVRYLLRALFRIVLNRDNKKPPQRVTAGVSADTLPLAIPEAGIRSDKHYQSGVTRAAPAGKS